MSDGLVRKLGEAVAWIAFAGFAYYHSFSFERGIEIYKFGASGWPRTIILLIVIAAICHAITVLLDAKRGTATVADDEPVGDATAEGASTGRTTVLRILGVLGLPVIYAVLMESVGFYFLTPLFIFFFLLLAGERRWKMLLGVTFGIYVLMVFLFGRLLYINLPVGNMHPFYDFSNWLLVVIR